MRQEVYPRYGNTHTTSSATGAQTTAFREEARRIIAEAVNAKVSTRGGGSRMYGSGLVSRCTTDVAKQIHGAYN